MFGHDLLFFCASCMEMEMMIKIKPCFLLSMNWLSVISFRLENNHIDSFGQDLMSV